MRKNSKISKIATTITIFIFIMLMIISISIAATNNSTSTATIKGGKTGTETINLSEGTVFTLNKSNLWKNNDNVYCVEYCRQFPSTLMDYKASEVINVTDPLLLYILNEKDADKSASGWKVDYDKKQNLIWKYIYDGNTAEAIKIKDLGENHDTNPPKHLDLDLWKELNQKANEYNNNKYNISITSMKEENGYVTVKVSGNYDGFKLYINGSSYCGEYDKNTTEVKIPVSKFTSDNRQVKIVGLKERLKASIYVLMNDDSQKLICVFNTGETTETFGTITSVIWPEGSVSLQKYIVKVEDDSGNLVKNYNSERKNRKADKDTKDPIYRKSNGTAQNSTGSYKYNETVKIDVGDWVTYKIHVYNNSDINLQSITVLDNLQSFSKYFDKYEVLNANGSIIKTENTNNSTKIGPYTHAISNLGAGKETYFYIRVHFNRYTEGILKNTAKIVSTGPNANTSTYRIEDSDYVKMNTYAVSLEKYVSGVNINNSNIDVSAYTNILEYLKENTGKTINGLFTACRDYTLGEYKNYDLNGDGVIDAKDASVYESIKDGMYNLDAIQNYINADINGDGIVDNNDLEAYKILRANLNSDINLNEYDRYMFIIKTLSDRGQLTDNNLELLYIQRLAKNENKTIEELKVEYDNYIRSDVDDNAYVNSLDNYKVENNKVTLYGKEFDLKITEAIERLEDISDLEETIDNYDLNGDGILNQTDIDIIKEYINSKNDTYSGKYQYIKNIANIEKFKETFKDTFRTEDILAEYNINNDQYVDFDDYMMLKEWCETSNSYKTLLDNLKGELSKKVDTFDLNGDKKSDYQDYEILIEYESAKKKIGDSNVNITNLENILKNYNIVDIEIADAYTDKQGVSEDDINTIKVYRGWKEYNEKYANKETFNYDLYDLNRDGKINQEDKSIIDKNPSYSVDSLINDVFNTNDIDKFIDTYIEVKENSELIDGLNIDFSDIDSTSSNYDTLKNIISTLNGKAEDVLNYMNISRISNIKYEDIQKQMEVDITTIDANRDGFITEQDKALLNDLPDISQISSEEIANIVSTGGGDKDLNGDGQWNSKDDDLAKEVKEIANKTPEEIEKIKNAFANYQLDAREGKAEHKYDNDTTTNDYWKYNNVVDVAKGDKVTYTIKVTNNSENASVYITKIADYLPDGVKYKNVTYDGNQYDTQTDNKVEFTTLSRKLLKPGESASFKITVEVTESNMSLETLKNVAEITEMKNENRLVVEDTTPNDNKDADYIQLKDITISGTVWNDIAVDKNTSNYNGNFDTEIEKGLEGIKVSLYRISKNSDWEEKTEPSNGYVANTTTDENGNYTFNIDHIKAPKYSSNNRWQKSPNKGQSYMYYSYLVVFEYDGITYTSTTYTEFGTSGDTSTTSNAKEDNGMVKEGRTKFNNRFSTINNESGINYTTINENGYIPQSSHIYNSDMAMNASTNMIDLSKDDSLIEKLQHVNLGLRGRDTFDLELASDIYSTKVTVNGVDGEYSYGNNVVEIRKSDIQENTVNVAKETRESTISSVDQNIRKTDIQNEAYEDTKLGIEVTYKLTIKNSSITDGTATKVVDYYDSKYTYIRSYVKSDNGNLTTLSAQDDAHGDGYKSVVITTPGTILKQSETMEIYVVYELNNPTEALKVLLNGEESAKLPTYNMAEIAEYKTQCAEGQTEYTRGLIDVDSAPGSANKEQVRLTTTQGENTATTEGNPTTVEYYFGGNDLTKLKYEDDTYATPTLYFVSSDKQRTITGTVFRDNTITDSVTRIKTGDGIINDGEVGVYGAQVKLIEMVNGTETQRYETTTDVNGKYTFTGFLPGTYIIRYYYGNKTETVLLHQSGNVNEYSYNGEDYQSTNNTGTYGAEKLNNTKNYWYLYNETDGISVATDSAERRNTVSENVTEFIDEEMKVLNNIRDGKNAEEAKVTYQSTQGQKTITVDDIITKTYMNANTNTMLFNVEKPTKTENNLVEQTGKFAAYEITNMNFGIAEVPVTTIDLQKNVAEFTITDSTGTNVIASMKYENGKWILKGDVLLANDIDVSIEEDKLQGARLEVTYKISVDMTTEKNFDNKSLTVPTITGIADFINNNFSYDQNLGDNNKYWEVTTYQDIKNIYEKQQWKEGTKPQGTVDPKGEIYTTIVKAKADNPLLLTTEGKGEATITLEKILTSTDTTIEDIITSAVDSFEYYNVVEILGIDYNNVTPNPDGSTTSTNSGELSNPNRDRIRTTNKYIIIPGVQYDSASSETLVIHQPTGDSSISIMYYIIAVIGLAVFAVGVFSIKKFVIKK